MATEHIHLVTGRLAEYSLPSTVAPLASEIGFDYPIDVLTKTAARHYLRASADRPEDS